MFIIRTFYIFAEKKMIYSCGIIVFRKNAEGKYEFFLGHPGGSKWEGKDLWYFLKGEANEGEAYEETAVREFQEESGLILSQEEKDSIKPLGQIRQNSKKHAVAFALEKSDIDPRTCFSNMVDGADFPEMDAYCWLSEDDLLEKINPKYMVFFNKIINNEF